MAHWSNAHVNFALWSRAILEATSHGWTYPAETMAALFHQGHTVDRVARDCDMDWEEEEWRAHSR